MVCIIVDKNIKEEKCNILLRSFSNIYEILHYYYLNHLIVLLKNKK